MVDQRGGIATEQTADEFADHGLADVLFAHGRLVDEQPPLLAMFQYPLGLHLLQHGGDGGRGETMLRDEGGMDLAAGGLPPRPQHMHDRELEVPEAVTSAHGPTIRRQTTLVVGIPGIL